MGDPVVFFEILGRDPRALRAFYADAFGWEAGPPQPGANEYAPVAAGPGGIAGGIGAGFAGYAGHVTFYVEVANLEEALGRVEALGGATVVPPGVIPSPRRIAMFRDPEGHVVGLVEATA